MKVVESRPNLAKAFLSGKDDFMKALEAATPHFLKAKNDAKPHLDKAQPHLLSAWNKAKPDFEKAKPHLQSAYLSATSNIDNAFKSSAEHLAKGFQKTQGLLGSELCDLGNSLANADVGKKMVEASGNAGVCSVANPNANDNSNANSDAT